MTKPPCTYSYNPRWSTIVLAFIACFGCAAFFTYQAWFNDAGLIIEHIWELDTNGATIFYWSFAGLLYLAGVFSVLMGMRKVFSPKVLKLDVDAITLPYGMLQRLTARIQYSSITDLNEQTVSRQKLLTIHTRTKKYTLARVLMPNSQAYEEVKTFLAQQIRR